MCRNHGTIFKYETCHNSLGEFGIHIEFQREKLASMGSGGMVNMTTDMYTTFTAFHT